MFPALNSHGMDHQTAKHVFVGSLANHFDFPPTSLFCRCADGDDAAVDRALLDGLGRPNGSRQPRRGDQIVAAGVSNVLQCIVPGRKGP